MTVKLRYRSTFLILGKKIYKKDYSRPKGRWSGVAKQYTLLRIQYFALRLAVRETGLPPPPIPHQNPRLAPRTVHQHAQTDFSIFGPYWPYI